MPAQVVADSVILAEDAVQVTLAEEDGAATVPATQAILLAKVGEGTGHSGEFANAASANFIFATIDATIFGTEITLRQMGK